MKLTRLGNRSLSGLTVLALLLAGCAQMPGTPATLDRDRYRQLFSAAIARSLSEKPQNNLCLPPQFAFGPQGTGNVDVAVDTDVDAPNPSFVNPLASQMKALEGAGLVVGKPVERILSGKTHRFIAYARTKAGQQFWVENAFCYGKAELDHVIKWKGPLVLGEYQVAWVYFTVRNTNVADWANSTAVQTAFPTLRSTLQEGSSKVRQTLLDLSSEGWDVAEFAKYLQLQ